MKKLHQYCGLLLIVSMLNIAPSLIRHYRHGGNINVNLFTSHYELLIPTAVLILALIGFITLTTVRKQALHD
ncbi:hypothetical protein [Priestia koreensis]|uniref:hypothetical protein n=1 Tax=Priestia koreensis TaxID=284581 RepID=UPI00345A684A